MSKVTVTMSPNGLVNLYDTNITDEDDALIQVFNHGSSIAHADFLSDHEVFALSHDEIFSIYDLKDSPGDDTSNAAPHFGDLRPQLHCDYVVDLMSSRSMGPVFGAGSHSGQHVDIVPLRRQTSWSLEVSETIRLPGGHGEEVIRSMCSSHDEKTIFTAGEDGQIKAWRPSGEENNATKIKEVPREDKKRKKHKSGDDHERARFKPY
ncbi:hypothetical protein Q9189_003021 [Teloschistes chrysophthalmus]